MPLPERKLIERIRAASQIRAAALMRGIGDDCAVLRPAKDHELLVTTDFSIEGVHFRREWHPAESVGHRCLARGLSDIAAMGGEPLAAFLSLALPVDLPQKWTDGFLEGLLRLAKSYRVPLAGGDIAQSPAGVVADIVVVGSAPRGKAVLRSNARPGDAIYVSGDLGGSVAALQLLRAGKKLRARDYPQHFCPTPRMELGRALRQKKLASAMIDISDGMSVDLAHLCEESGVGGVIEAESIPVSSKSTLELALHGGEDYELLFTSRARLPKRIAGVKVTQIGQIVSRRGVWIVGADGSKSALKPLGWEHFAHSATD